MNRFAASYERALFPRRRRGGGDGGDVDALDIAVGAGFYRLVCAVETLMATLRGSVRRLRAGAPAERPGTPGLAGTVCDVLHRG